MTIARNPSTAVLLRRRAESEPQPDDSEIAYRSFPDPGDGQLRFRVLWLSLDPYMAGG